MHTRLAPEFHADDKAAEAQAILGRCVHCGFCTATCPTYQLLGDELDGPRGRIHLIKQAFEGETVTGETRLHLDRCLTCRACETTCPSGVEYGRLLDHGRALVEKKAPRSLASRVGRRALAAFLTGPLFAPLLGVGRALHSLLPARLAARIPAARARGEWPGTVHPRRVLLLQGCVHESLAPDSHAALARVLDNLGMTLVRAPGAGCCGALRHHLTQEAGALADARRNVDAWWPELERGAEAIVVAASGCGPMVRDYGRLLQRDAAYSERARRISALVRDPVEILLPHRDSLRQLVKGAPAQRVAFHSPCSLQHGLKMRGVVEGLLADLGAELVPVAEGHMCCGSAGTYTLLQPALSSELARRKVAALAASDPRVVLTANTGCMVQIASGTDIPVMHWIEWVAHRSSCKAL